MEESELSSDINFDLGNLDTEKVNIFPFDQTDPFSKMIILNSDGISHQDSHGGKWFQYCFVGDFSGKTFKIKPMISSCDISYPKIIKIKFLLCGQIYENEWNTSDPNDYFVIHIDNFNETMVPTLQILNYDFEGQLYNIFDNKGELINRIYTNNLSNIRESLINYNEYHRTNHNLNNVKIMIE